MKIAILGAQGRLGQELTYVFQEDHEVMPLSRYNVDVTSFQMVQEVLGGLVADMIINCVGISELPNAQNKKSEEDIFQTNTVGAAHVAMFAKENKIPLVHISCASVLGEGEDKKVTAERGAIEVVGQSKLEAEEMIERIYEEEKDKNYLIVRLGLLFGEYGQSLVKNIVRLVQKKTQIEAVQDVRYSFTSTALVAEFLKAEITKGFSGNIEHVCHPEKLTIVDLVRTISDLKEKKVKVKKVTAVSVDEQSLDYSLEGSREFESIEGELKKVI